MYLDVLKRLLRTKTAGGWFRSKTRAGRRPTLENLEGRQLLSGMDLGTGTGAAAIASEATIDPAPISADQTPVPIPFLPCCGGILTARVERVSLQPRLGRVLIQFRDAFGGVDANALAQGVSLTRLQSPRLPLRVTQVGTPTVPPGVLDPIPAAPTGPVFLGGTLQTVAVVFEFGRPLPRGSYLLTINSSVAQGLAGLPLDGEFNGSFPSGDGRTGGNFQAILSTNNIYSYLPTPIGGFFAPGNRLPNVQGGRPGSLLH
ncbi:hypothetical protein BH23PLA1_BH23PLA1_25930 [soil metagenome]